MEILLRSILDVISTSLFNTWQRASCTAFFAVCNAEVSSYRSTKSGFYRLPS